MKYKYTLEDKLKYDDDVGCGVLNIVCYYINNTLEQPYLQFILEKYEITNNGNIYKLNIPNIHTNVFNYNSKFTEKMNEILKYINVKPIGKYRINTIILNKNKYAFVNIGQYNPVNIKYDSDKYTIVVTSEIINYHHYNTNKICDSVVYLFESNPELGILYKDTDILVPINIPDIVYVNKQDLINLQLGPEKKQIGYSTYYYYYLYKNYNINYVRCVIFMNNWALYTEKSNNISITNDYINNINNFDIINIHYANGKKQNQPDIITNKYEIIDVNI